MLIVPLFFIMQLLNGSRLPDFGPRLVRGLSFDATETFSKLLLLCGYLRNLDSPVLRSHANLFQVICQQLRAM